MFEVDLTTFEARPFSLLDKEWAILVGGKERPNPMTVSWGGMGTLWNRPVLSVYVRPTRFTFEGLNAHPEFTLNFLPISQRKALEVCGSTTGRDANKWELAQLTAEPAARIAVPRVKQAHLVFECRLLSHADIDPAHFREPKLESLYPLKDYHRIFFGEVLGVFQSEPTQG
jgi:flavin reductase (DIM6/NTAB) family NADH-FMN oxidoreductase RutF